MKARILLVSDTFMDLQCPTTSCEGFYWVYCDFLLQEIEFFMSHSDKNNSIYFPKYAPRRLCTLTLCFAYSFASIFLHVIVPNGEARCPFLQKCCFDVLLTVLVAEPVLLSIRAS
jgi:hypothetical protein